MWEFCISSAREQLARQCKREKESSLSPPLESSWRASVSGRRRCGSSVSPPLESIQRTSVRGGRKEMFVVIWEFCISSAREQRARQCKQGKEGDACDDMGVLYLLR